MDIAEFVVGNAIVEVVVLEDAVDKEFVSDQVDAVAAAAAVEFVLEVVEVYPLEAVDLVTAFESDQVG